jgi:phosphate starvation-inducible protein PhoH and related proteins
MFPWQLLTKPPDFGHSFYNTHLCITQDLKLQTVLSILSESYTTGFNPDLTESAGGGNDVRNAGNCKTKIETDLRDTIINLETVNPIEFFGVNNGKLDILKRKFPLLKILSRGTQLKLSGAPEQVDGAKEKIDLIVQYLERNGHMSENYFEQILGGDDAETIDNFVERNPNDVLVFGPNGKTVRARTANQKKLVSSSEKNDVVFAIGPAGTGKTYTAVAMAVRALKNKAVKKIILTRPAVEAGESLGFLPGDLKEKIDPYLRPLYDALDDMIPADKLGYYMSTRTIEIAPLAYMRGRTLDNCFIILDEAQNATDLQIKMFLTRIGANAKAIITGDLTQVDLPRHQKSGLEKASKILKNIDGIGHIELDEEDVVRHKLVKAILKAYDKEGQREQEIEEAEKKERKERRYDRERD